MNSMGKIYHITTSENWDLAVAKELYDFCALKTDGFIHCSTFTQVIKTANDFFKGADNLIVLEIETDKTQSEIRFENLEGGDEKFPHIYGPVELDAVVGLYTLIKNNENLFMTLTKIKR